jgi:hypothetical protein
MCLRGTDNPVAEIVPNAQPIAPNQKQNVSPQTFRAQSSIASASAAARDRHECGCQHAAAHGHATYPPKLARSMFSRRTEFLICTASRQLPFTATLRHRDTVALLARRHSVLRPCHCHQQLNDPTQRVPARFIQTRDNRRDLLHHMVGTQFVADSVDGASSPTKDRAENNPTRPERSLI